MITNYVTGAKGFIGQHLCRKLGVETVKTIDHRRIGKEGLLPFEKFFFLSTYGNLWGHKNWKAVVKANVTDLVYLLRKSFDYPGGTFVFVSSSSVNLPTHTPYSCCKMAAEHILASAHKEDRRTIIARPYSVIGVGEQKQHLIPTLIRSCLNGEKMQFYPFATHDFVDVEDFVDGLLLVSESAPSGIYEFGNGRTVPNAEVRALVESITGKVANVELTNYGRPYDDSQWYCRNCAAKKMGWTPKKSLRDTITEMVTEYEHTAKKVR
jgi:nucleoside-diphosphate-sugar epimerase